MSIVIDIAEAMQVIFTQRADELARETGFVKRQRKLYGSTFVQALVFGWLAESEARLETLSQSVSNVDIEVNISRQGLAQRFTREASVFLEAVLYESIACVIASRKLDSRLLRRFEGVYVMDSTVISLPDCLASIWQGCEGSAVKLSVCWELLGGELVHLQLQDGKVHDQKAWIQSLSLPENALRLADLGYFKLDVLQQQQQAGVRWVTRYKGNTVIKDEAGQRLDVLDLLSQHADETVLDLPIQLGATHAIPSRFIAQRVSDEQLQQRQEQLRRWESRKQKQASPRRWALLAWSIYITNAPCEQLDATEVMLMARVRWQIELLFKLWKDVVDIDDWRSNHDWRILCEVYAKLIACIVQHWLLLVGGVHALDRSMTQATPVIQHWAWALAYALSHKPTLCHFIAHIGQILARSCRISTSASSLPTFQRIEQYVP